MPHTTDFGKHRREILSNDRLPQVLRKALIEFKNRIRSGPPPQPFKNLGIVLPAVGRGQRYYEWQVGEARAPTPEHPTLRGSYRLVALVDAGDNILRMYYTQEHYEEAWKELQYP